MYVTYFWLFVRFFQCAEVVGATSSEGCVVLCVQVHSDRASNQSQVVVHNEQYLQDDCRCLGRLVASLFANSSHYGSKIYLLTY